MKAVHTDNATLARAPVGADTAADAAPIKAAASAMTDAVAQEAHRFGEMARTWWQSNAELVREAVGTVRDEAGALGERGQRYVRDEPVKSVLIAAAVGAAVTGLVMLALKRDR
ncbi:MAG: hypothetical protein JNN03_16810 [Rubrivivax sp.]|nr:hypothetical protein [Rubrivivax sp.]